MIDRDKGNNAVESISDNPKVLTKKGRPPRNVSIERIRYTLKLGKMNLVAQVLGVSRAYIYQELKKAGLYERYAIKSRRESSGRDNSGQDLRDV